MANYKHKVIEANTLKVEAIAVPTFTCSTCTWYKAMGECHRYPPTVVVINREVLSKLPVCHSLAYCGEYKGA